jgi:hypothetical protein
MDDFFLDTIPDAVLASMQVRDHWFDAQGLSGDGEAFFLDDLLRWLPGTVITVAFLGGDTALHRDIETATRQLTDACNLGFDFGFDEAAGAYRTWSTSDEEYAADIRVSFDQPGFKSLIGRDSINSGIGPADSPMGGRPYQRSLNLGGFPIQRPQRWMGVVRHEFLHAIAFKHEHQSPAGACDRQYRWEDPPGYVPTLDADGRYIADAAGLQPGIYTYLAGAPNHWSRQTVDHNLRPRPADGAIVGGFDKASIMMYKFPREFYHEFPNPCSATGNGLDLSPGDIAGLLRIYPFDEREAGALTSRRSGVVEVLYGWKELPDSFRAGVDNLRSRR